MLRCNLIIGDSGCGKTTHVIQLADTNDMEFYQVTDLSIASIKDIALHNITHPRLYCFENVETMSIQSQNALLKVLEEGNSHMYFALTATNLITVLPTIISRSNIIKVKSPTKAQIKEYLALKTADYEYYERKGLVKLCNTYGDVDLVEHYAEEGLIDSMLSLAELVDRNIAEVVISNALKITDRLKVIEDSDEAYILFLRILLSVTKKYKIKARVSQTIAEIKTKAADRNRLMNKLFIDLRFS